MGRPNGERAISGVVWLEETEDGVVLHMRVGLWVMGQAAVTGQSRVRRA